MRNNTRIIVTVVLVIVFAALVVYIGGCAQQNAKNEALKADIIRISEQAWSSDNLDVLDDIFASDCVFHRANHDDIIGLDAYKQYVRDIRSAYPDMLLKNEDIFMAGDKVCSTWLWSGTHSGQGGSAITIPPTGRKVSNRSIGISRIEAGKIVEYRSCQDYLGLVGQMGYKITPPITATSFARVTVNTMKLDKMAEGIKLFKESVVPAGASQKGFRGVLLLTDIKTGKGLSISLWDSEADAVANEESGYYKEQVDKFKDIFTTRPVREGYMVTVQE